MSEFPGLDFVQDETRLLARVVPVPERAALTVEAVRTALDAAGYGQ